MLSTVLALINRDLPLAIIQADLVDIDCVPSPTAFNWPWFVIEAVFKLEILRPPG